MKFSTWWTTSRTRLTNPDTAAKGIKTYEIPKLTKSNREKRFWFTRWWQGISHVNEVFEYIWLEFDVYIKLKKENMHCFYNNVMSTFNRTILMQGVSLSQINNKDLFLKKLLNFRIVVKFINLIHSIYWFRLALLVGAIVSIVSYSQLREKAFVCWGLPIR